MKPRNPAKRDFSAVFLGTGFGKTVGFVINSQGSSDRAASMESALKSLSSFCSVNLSLMALSKS